MLVLTRKPGQKIIIDNRISVTVVSVKNGQVRIGFEAPSHVNIVREELAVTLRPQTSRTIEMSHN